MYRKTNFIIRIGLYAFCNEFLHEFTLFLEFVFPLCYDEDIKRYIEVYIHVDRGKYYQE